MERSASKGVPCEAPSGKQAISEDNEARGYLHSDTDVYLLATSEDNEARGYLHSDTDVYLLANAAMLGKPVSKAYIDMLQTQFANLFSVDDGAPTSVESCAKASAVVYVGTHHHSEHDCHSPVVPNLHQLATNLQKMTPQQRDDEADASDRPDRSCVNGVTLVHQLVTEMRLLFTKDVVVVVDEVSMFSAQNLSLLDQRLRQLYYRSKMFGGISILLVGDFLQL